MVGFEDFAFSISPPIGSASAHRWSFPISCAGRKKLTREWSSVGAAVWKARSMLANFRRLDAMMDRKLALVFRRNASGRVQNTKGLDRDLEL